MSPRQRTSGPPSHSPFGPYTRSYDVAEPIVSPKPIRADIQALRGIAVLLVLMYHAKLGFPGGYLGVDVFFVISGYLMTGLIVAGIERDDFTFSDFYFRRAKRLLPAAYATFLATAILAPIFLTPSSLVEFSKQMVGAVSYTANIVLFRQTGYFGGAADLKPFLHVWSLSLEEQYYFILPASLVFIPRRHWLKLAGATVVFSAAACAVAAVRNPSAAFYWLPFRAWELGLGSLGVLISQRQRRWLQLRGRALIWPAVLALVVIPMHPMSGLHPGPDAAIVCIATFVIILSNVPSAWTNLPSRGLARVGDYSYSLYLVHWPIFALAANAWVGNDAELPSGIRIGAVLLSLILGYALYWYVETPVRRRTIRPSPPLLGGLVAGSVVLVAIPSVTARATDHVNYADIRDWNFGLGLACRFDSKFNVVPQCETSTRPSILVWGDSYAMQLVTGITATVKDAGVLQATKSVCGPLLSVAPIEKAAGTAYNRSWAERCISFNQSVIEYLRNNHTIETVVLSSPLLQYLDESKFETLRQEADAYRVAPPTLNVAVAGLRRTVDTLRALGRKVVIVAPPPSTGFNIGLCLERRAQGKFRFGAAEDCSVDRSDYLSIRAPMLALLDTVARAGNVPVFRFDPFLCDSQRCITQLGKTFLYRDEGHFSRAGSKLIGERLSFGDSLRAIAR